MRIVHVAEWNELTGGAYTVVNNLVHCSLKINPDLDIHIVSYSKANNTIFMDGYTIHLVKSKFFITSKYWYSHRVLKKKILELKPDIVHLHFTYPPYSLLTNLTFPVVTTTHGLSSVSMKQKGSYALKHYLKLNFLLEPYFEKKALNKSKSIIAVSNWIKNEVESIIGPANKIIYIPNGINLSKSSVKINVSDRASSIVHPSIFYVGRLIKFKGVDILIDALYEVKKQIPEIHLYIAGAGCQLKRLERKSEILDLTENITFLGYLSEAEKEYFFSESDIFVIPSRYETFGIVVLEALARGTPVIASNVGGIPDILGYGEYGILFNPEDVQDLTKSIVSLLSNSKLQKELSEKGIRRVQEYLWDDIAKETLDLYSSLVNQ